LRRRFLSGDRRQGVSYCTPRVSACAFAFSLACSRSAFSHALKMSISVSIVLEGREDSDGVCSRCDMARETNWRYWTSVGRSSSLREDAERVEEDLTGWYESEKGKGEYAIIVNVAIYARVYIYVISKKREWASKSINQGRSVWTGLSNTSNIIQCMQSHAMLKRSHSHHLHPHYLFFTA
jgi:hypothetical protein